MPLLVAEVGKPVVASAYGSTPLVALETDAPLEEVPAVVLRAADLSDGFDPDRWSRSETQPGAQGTVVWFRGEHLISGESAYIRRDLHLLHQRTFVPVHLPCMSELDLVGLQPRWYAGELAEDRIHHGVRIAAPPVPAPILRDFFEQAELPWARLYRALLHSCRDPRNGLAALEALRASQGLHATLDGLVLRNQAVLLFQLEDFEQAGRLLNRGISAYPDYADLHYLAARVAVAQGDPNRAVQQLQLATRQSDPSMVGSGGENSFRAHWLLATLSEAVGNEAVAFHHFRFGLYTRPAYEPSVVALLKHRYPEDSMKQLAYDLAGLARREPKYLEPVVYYLLLHGKFGVVSRILETHSMDARIRARLSERLEAFSSRSRNNAAPDSSAGVCLIGPFFVHSSLARINREIGVALLRSAAFQTCLEPHGFGNCRPDEFPRSESLQPGFMRRAPSMRLTIRHHWPPNFRRPAEGKLAVILPWEYGAVPRRWIEAVRNNVDELWVPSAFVRRVFVEGGAPAGRIQVIPNGVDTAVFRPEGSCWRPPTARGFAFLFVGGAIQRKGVDLLAAAYGRAFSAHDDVSLIVKEIGSDTFYRHNSLIRKLRSIAGRRHSPRLVVLSGEVPDEALASLYRGTDAFVLPYRAEGFAMPVAEAMACGKPVIVTAAGPAPEFVPAELGYWVTARRALVPEPPPPLGEMAGEFTWFEPDVDELAARMREVFENRDEAACRGTAGAEHVRQTLSWQSVCRAYLDRVTALLGGLPAEAGASIALSVEAR